MEDSNQLDHTTSSRGLHQSCLLIYSHMILISYFHFVWKQQNQSHYWSQSQKTHAIQKPIKPQSKKQAGDAKRGKTCVSLTTQWSNVVRVHSSRQNFRLTKS